MSPPKPPAVLPEVALAKVRHHLAGLRGYSPRDESVAHLARVVQSVCVSVDHADAVLSTFDEECPTPREIKDVARNLRDRYLPPSPSPVEEWKKQYGEPDKEWSDALVQAAAGNVHSLGDRKLRHKTDMYTHKVQALKDAVYAASPEGQAELNAIKGSKEREASKQFWAQAIARDEREYPAQIAAIRAGREPEFKEAPPKVLSIRRPITAESFQGLEPMHVERCHNCGGSGRLAGDDYCDECQTGRDLRKIESSHGNGTENP